MNELVKVLQSEVKVSSVLNYYGAYIHTRLSVQIKNLEILEVIPSITYV